MWCVGSINCSVLFLYDDFSLGSDVVTRFMLTLLLFSAVQRVGPFGTPSQVQR